eukprot:4879127-Pyramimonas_sp.AAC.2
MPFEGGVLLRGTPNQEGTLIVTGQDGGRVDRLASVCWTVALARLRGFVASLVGACCRDARTQAGGQPKLAVSYINVSKSTTASVNDIQQSSKDASVDPSLDELRKELGLMRDPDDKLLLVDLKDRTPTKRNIGGSNGGVVTKDLADDNREEMQRFDPRAIQLSPKFRGSLVFVCPTT